MECAAAATRHRKLLGFVGRPRRGGPGTFGSLRRVIPRLRLRSLTPSGSATWPETAKGYPSLFRGRQPYRKLVVLIDNHLLVDPPHLERSRRAQLAGLLAHPLVEFYRHADAGPPVGAFRASEGSQVAPGWVTLGEDGDNPSLVYEHGEGVRYTGIMGNGVSFAARDVTTSSYRDGGWEQAIASRRADARAVGATEAIHADVFVTDRPYVFEALGGRTNGVTCLTPEAALPLLGLYLRAQGAYAVYGTGPLGPALVRWNRGLLYWVGARQALPAGWRWFSACVQHADGGGDERVLYLGGSVLQRIERALRARDVVHIALNQPQNNDTADEALAAFDEAALLLMGAVDASASVAHAALKIPKPPKRAGWHAPDWIKEVQNLRPSLAAVVAPGTAAEAALTVLRQMRNTIHGEAMTAIGTRGTGMSRAETHMSMPGVDQATLLAATGASGGDASWGITAQPQGIRAEMDVLLERLLHEVIEALNLLMEETPVESLAHVTLAPDQSKPPNDGADSVWSAANRLAVAWQLGLEGRAEQP